MRRGSRETGAVLITHEKRLGAAWDFLMTRSPPAALKSCFIWLSSREHYFYSLQVFNNCALCKLPMRSREATTALQKSCWPYSRSTSGKRKSTRAQLHLARIIRLTGSQVAINYTLPTWNFNVMMRVASKNVLTSLNSIVLENVPFLVDGLGKKLGSAYNWNWAWSYYTNNNFHSGLLVQHFLLVDDPNFIFILSSLKNPLRYF